MQHITLNNGVEMPNLGYGVYQIQDHEECERCVVDAISVGYGHLDTAASYMNEEAVGKGIISSCVVREDIFLTFKLWVATAPCISAAGPIFTVSEPFGAYFS